MKDRKNLPAAPADNAVQPTEAIEVTGGNISNKKAIQVTIPADGILMPVNGTFQFLTAESHYRAQFARKKADAMRMIGVIRADQRHDFHNYWYASIHAINAQVQNACAHVGLALSCTPIGDLVKQNTDGKKTDAYLHKFEFTLTDAETGYFETAVIAGSADDETGASALTKCMRAAQKDFVVSTFMISIDNRAPTEREAFSVQNLAASCENLVTYLESVPQDELTDALISAGGQIERKWAPEYLPFGLQILETYFSRLKIKAICDEIDEAYKAETIEDAGISTWRESVQKDLDEWF